MRTNWWEIKLNIHQQKIIQIGFSIFAKNCNKKLELNRNSRCEHPKITFSVTSVIGKYSFIYKGRVHRKLQRLRNSISRVNKSESVKTKMLTLVASIILIVQIIKLIFILQNKLRSFERGVEKKLSQVKSNNQNINTQNSVVRRQRNRRIVRNSMPRVIQTTNNVWKTLSEFFFYCFVWNTQINFKF